MRRDEIYYALIQVAKRHEAATARCCTDMTDAIVELQDRLAKPREPAPPAQKAEPNDTDVAWIVPRHPTADMMEAGLQHCSPDMQWGDLFTAFHHMVDAAPKPSPQAEPLPMQADAEGDLQNEIAGLCIDAWQAEKLSPYEMADIFLAWLLKRQQPSPQADSSGRDGVIEECARLFENDPWPDDPEYLYGSESAALIRTIKSSPVATGLDAEGQP